MCQKSDFGQSTDFRSQVQSKEKSRWAVYTAHPKGLKEATETLKCLLPPSRGLHIGTHRHSGGFGAATIYSGKLLW
jgi:hypothetical protein